MSHLASVQVMVYGLVQNVFFRDFTLGRARELGLNGYVRNLPGGAVEVAAEGEKKKLEELITHLKVGPPRAEVEKVETNWSRHSNQYTGFSVRY